MTSLCRAVVGERSIRGTVITTDDAAGILQLDDNRVVALAKTDSPRRIAEGIVVEARGVEFQDGSLYARTAAPLSITNPALWVPPCLSLQIAPFQRFWPVAEIDPANVVLHNPQGYLVDSVLRLEVMMRLGVKSGSCPTDGKIRYSAEIELTYRDMVSEGILTTVLASDLTPSEHPVALPAAIDPGTLATITINVRKQNCKYQSNPVVKKIKKQCTAPQQLSTATYSGWVIQKGGYFATLKFSQTILDLEDGESVTFRPVTLEGTSSADAILSGANYHAEAEGYLVSGASSSKPEVSPIAEGDSFAVYNADFWNPGSQYEAVGVDHAAGLRWPRIKGTRNGHSFWYSAAVPTLIKDAITFCPDFGVAHYSFYRLPWPYAVTRVVGQGNNGNLTHKGNQMYAFDFGLFNGGQIRAARGGIVTLVEESLWKNSDPIKVKAKQEKWEPANALRIEHQDGTASWYYHMQQNGVLVNDQDTVYRGDYIAIVGNTGNSTGPHLHYHVQYYPDGGTASMPIRFQTWGQACYIPEKDNVLKSNNDEP
jgi:murein DD-endopeptidase MepM/ murein hydrolase activator NlpD